MKKFIPLAVLAVIFMASCSEDEVITESGNDTTAIRFTSVVNNNSTRATVGLIDLAALKTSTDGFAVSTNGLGTGQEMNNLVVKYNTAWGYTGDYYWPISSTQNVSFAAYAPAGTANVALTSSGLTATNFVPSSTVGSQIDLLYAAPANFTRSVSGASGVALTFNHILSQVVFSVTTDIPTTNVPKIESIVLTVPNNQGNYNGTAWTAAANSHAYTLFSSTAASSTAVTSTPLLLVPQASLTGITAAVTFSVNGASSTNTVSLSTLTTVTSWQPGAKITYNVTFNSADLKVKFTDPTISVWTNTSDSILY